MHLLRWLRLPSLFMLLPLTLAACGTSAPAAPNEGAQLEVISTSPPLTMLQAISITQSFLFEADVITDNPMAAGRLYLQVNGSCCNINIANPTVTLFIEQAYVQPVDANAGRYTMTFQMPVQPCTHVPLKSIAYVIPAFASGGFVDGPTGVEPVGLGIVDNLHYWTVACP